MSVHCCKITNYVLLLHKLQQNAAFFHFSVQALIWSWGQSYFSYVSSLKPGLANKIFLVQRETHVLQVVLYGFGNIYKVLTYLRTWWLLCDHKLWQRIRRLWQRQTMPTSSQVNNEHWGWKITVFYIYSRCGRNNCIKAFKSTFPGEEYKVRKVFSLDTSNVICKCRQIACMMYLMIAATSLTSSMRIFQEDTMRITLRNRHKVFYLRGISLKVVVLYGRGSLPRQPCECGVSGH